MDKVNIVIGKDIIESLTQGMYEDSKFIFREYIQNSADQIDKAIHEGLISKENAYIHISINSNKKVILIEDNATGISNFEVISVLRNIAQSSKKRGVDKGFRGIGRLGGLAYCNKLTFETSFKGEAIKSIMVWDAYQLRKIINDRINKENASDVINKITELIQEPEESDSHYFKVILEGVNNTDLLEQKKIKEYIEMVAPLPFYSTRFIFKPKIDAVLKEESLPLDEYKIYLDTDQLFKAYTADIFRKNGSGKEKIGEFFDIKVFKKLADDGSLLYWGWYGLSNFQSQQLNPVNKARGIRLRKNNIQIGNEYALNKLHREDRSNFYFIGEVHAVHQDLIPNSRRDYFSENDTLKQFENNLKSFFHSELYPLYYGASEIHSAANKIQEANRAQEVLKEKKQLGVTNKEQWEALVEDASKKQDEAQKAKVKLEKIRDGLEAKPKSLRLIFDNIIVGEIPRVPDIELEKVNEPGPYRTDKLSRLTKEQRKLLSRVFTVIQKKLSFDGNLAESIIRAIEEDFI